MKQILVHVQDLARSIAFYTNLFGLEPVHIEEGRAIWMLDEPRIDFVIATGARGPGFDHLNLCSFGADELAELQARLRRLEISRFDVPVFSD